MADLLLQSPSISPRHAVQSPQRRKSISASWASATSPSSASQFKVATSSRRRFLFGSVSESIERATDIWRSQKAAAAKERKQAARFEEKKKLAFLRMKNAESWEEWQDAAKEVDALEGNDDWKTDSSSPTADYNPALIEERLRALDEARASGNTQAMMHAIRTSLSRNLGGMGNVELYKHSYLGTKTLVDRYVDSTIQTIDAVIGKSASDRGMPYRDLLEGMLLARQSFGRSALLLSGGGTFGMAHIGVLKALFEAQLLPRIISGASAGSIVCAVMCTRTDEEMPLLIKSFPYGDLAVFDPPGKPDGILDHLRRLFTEGSWSDIKNLSRVMRDMMGDITFQEAYNRTRRILNICVSNESIYELPRLLNYVTAPNVMIWSAVAASCSVPLVFSGLALLVKDPATGEHRPWNPTPQRWIDGSVENDLPMTRLAEMFNVNHFIVSQVNPHVAPFLSRDDYLAPESRAHPVNVAEGNGRGDWLETFASLARDEALHRLQFMAEMGFFPNVMTKIRSVLSQRYSGDINILPEITLDNLPVLLSNPTVDFMLKCCLVGQRATWPKLSRIRDCCAVELALDRAVHRLRARVVFSDSQSELRLLGNGQSEALQPPTQHSMLHPSITRASISHVPPRHQRRQSGSSLGPMRMFEAGNIIRDDDDDDIDDDARGDHLEAGSRTRSMPSANGPGKPMLWRASKSSTHIPQYDPTAISQARLKAAFQKLDLNVSKHLIPPVFVKDDVRRDAGMTEHELPLLMVSETDSTDPATDSHGPLSSPLEDNLETSEQDHSSDADMEPVMDESSYSSGSNDVSPGITAKKFKSTGQVIGTFWGLKM